MNRLLSLLAVAGVIWAGTAAIAQEKPADATPAVAAPATTTVAAAQPTVPSSAAPTSAATTPPPAPADVAPISAELKDGTKIEMGGDGVVSIVNADGSKTPAPDGTLTLRDGTTFTIKNGKRLVAQ